MRFFIVLSLLFLPQSVLAQEPQVPGSCTCEYTVKECSYDVEISGRSGTCVTSNIQKIDMTDEGITDEASCDETCRIWAEIEQSENPGSIYKIFDSTYVFSSEEITSQAAEAIRHTYLTPDLAIDIPGLSFGDVLSRDGKLQINFLAEYINGVYIYLLGASAIVAIVMIMIGGVQYMIGSSVGHADAAKKRIQNAAIGLILIMGAYVILRVVNPELTELKSIQLVEVEAVTLDLDTSGLEGESGGGSASDCEGAFDLAQASDSCPLSQPLYSPNGQPFSCNYHFRDADYDWEEMTAGLDFPAAWGSEVVAPGDGTVEFVAGDGSNRCGNYIDVNLTGGGRFTICHVKAFATNLEGNPPNVKAGDVIGYIGGRCCATSAEDVPQGWSMSQRGWCTDQGTECGSPYGGNTDCDCQNWKASGNTSGPHAHGSLFYGSSRTPLIACLDENYTDLSTVGAGESSTEERVCETNSDTGQITCE